MGRETYSRFLGEPRWPHSLHRVVADLALLEEPAEERMTAPVAVVSGRRLSAFEEVGNERLDVLAPDPGRYDRHALAIEEAGEMGDGSRVG